MVAGRSTAGPPSTRPHEGDLERDRPRALPQPAGAGRRRDGRHRDDRAGALRPRWRAATARCAAAAPHLGLRRARPAARRHGSRSLELPVDAPLFQDPESRIVVLTNRRPRAAAVSGAADRRAHPGRRARPGRRHGAPAHRARSAHDAARGRPDAARRDAGGRPRGRAVPVRRADAGGRRRAVDRRRAPRSSSRACCSWSRSSQDESFLFLRYALGA